MADLGYEFGELCDNMLVHMFCSIHVLLSLSTPAKCGGFFLEELEPLIPFVTLLL